MSVGPMPALRIAPAIAIAAPRPVGSGAEMWNASAVSAAPMTSARIGAPRRSACSADSMTRMPAPSPKTNPSRVRSNGRDAPCGSSFRFESAPMFASAAKAIGRSGASEPPATTTSHSPVAISRSASWNAMTPDAQAATWVMTGPVSPYFIETWAAAMLPDTAGIANGLTWPGPFSHSVLAPSITCSMPPPPVLMTTATRSRSSGVQAAKSSPERSTASVAAATPKWMNRLIRRTIFRSIVSVGSKSLTSAAIFTSCPEVSNVVIGPAPETPPRRFVQYVAESLPIGVTAPIAVTTARRAGSWLGTLGTSAMGQCVRL